jgi:hypothetical protein
MAAIPAPTPKPVPKPKPIWAAGVVAAYLRATRSR